MMKGPGMVCELGERGEGDGGKVEISEMLQLHDAAAGSDVDDVCSSDDSRVVVAGARGTAKESERKKIPI